jgi:sporulation protein YtfJ
MSIAETLEVVLEKVRGLVQAETVIGKSIEAPDGSVILPVCKISVGFGAGGSVQNQKEGVGTGAGAVISPVAFLVLRNGKAEILPMDKTSWQFGKVLDLIPEVVERLRKPKAPKAPEDFSAQP